MVKKKEILIFVIIFLVVGSGFVFAEEYVDVDWNYNGQWASSGFSDFSGWKTFVDFFIGVMLNVRVIEINGHLALSSSDNLGNEKIVTDLIDFNNNTCKLNFGMNFTLPLGIKDSVSYDMALNGDYNICNIIDYKKYINKTLRDILIDAGGKNITVGFIGDRGNITIVPEHGYSTQNPRFNMTYSHVNDGNYPLLPSPVGNSGTTDLTNAELFDINAIDTGDFVNYNGNTQTLAQNNSNSSLNNGISNNPTNKITRNEFEIRNPIPSKSNVNLLLGETRIFSIENTDYESIKWALDGKIVENKSNSYNFKALKKGTYLLNVEIAKGLGEKANSWRIEVSQNAKSNAIFIYLLIGVIVILFLVIGIIIFKIKKQN